MNPPQTVTVSELTSQIKDSLERSFSSIRLKGEISNFKKQSSGHLYFSLKDEGATIAAVMFRGFATALKVLPKDGDQVIIEADVTVYPPSGRYQLIVKSLTLQGVGDLLLKLEELKKKLHKMGYFREIHKKPLPHMPKTIGIVTSPTGAAIQDMLHILKRRNATIHVILYPVKVQGDGAKEEIALAIKEFNRYKLADVLIVGRGGGSIEDLWAFNEEIVANAIFESDIPIISAVGHETDHCIADYVADKRAPTPSAAAEIVLAEQLELLKHLDQLSKRVTQTILFFMNQKKQKLEAILKQPVFKTPYTLLGPFYQKMDDLKTRQEQAIKERLRQKKTELKSFERALTSLNPITKIFVSKQKLQVLQTTLHQSLTHKLSLLHSNLQTITSSLKALDPKNVLKRGYGIVLSEKTDEVVASIQSIQKGDVFKILLSDGSFKTTVNEVNQ
jgi:exodeoxyribonuclease VII large subunit